MSVRGITDIVGSTPSDCAATFEKYPHLQRVTCEPFSKIMTDLHVPTV